MPTPLALALVLTGLATQEEGDPGDFTRLESTTGAQRELLSWLFDDLGVARASWAARGVTAEAYLTIDASSHFSGGADPGSSAQRALLDAIVELDGERVLGIADSRIVLGVQAFGGDDGSADVGVVQNDSNIDASDDRVQLARVWVHQGWRGGRTELHAGAGIVMHRLLEVARADALGLGVSFADLSDATGAPFTADSETAIERFWGLDLAPGMRLKPDLQYIIDPGGDVAVDDAWIATLRLTLTL